MKEFTFHFTKNVMPHLSAPELADWFRTVFAANSGLPSGIIFDCDGVLIDSREANIAYYNYLRNYVGLPPLPENMHDFVQAGTVNEVLDVIIPKPLRPLMREAVRKLSYMDEIMPHITYFPGLHGVLDLCKAAGIPMGIDTNRLNGMEIILDNCRLHGYFDPIVLVDSVPHPKPAPDGALFIAEKWGLEPASLLFIGDSASDRGAAQSAGIPFLSFQNQSLAKQSVAEYAILQEALQSLGL